MTGDVGSEDVIEGPVLADEDDEVLDGRAGFNVVSPASAKADSGAASSS